MTPQEPGPCDTYSVHGTLLAALGHLYGNSRSQKYPALQKASIL